ncbi:hypothetical protein LQZ21_04765 [Treponema sp. TIM-1]|uniref:hypothetical protein n=1 Tax=Treponema sp. TIM-1 TaxID=2898417 RepID=UPI00397F405B
MLLVSRRLSFVGFPAVRVISPRSLPVESAATAREPSVPSGCARGEFQRHGLYTFQVDSSKPLVKKHIVFLFSEKIGFKAYYDKKYYRVKFFDFLNKDKKSHLPQVTKRFIHDSFFAEVKVPELADRTGGERIPYD